MFVILEALRSVIKHQAGFWNFYDKENNLSFKSALLISFSKFCKVFHLYF